MRINSGRLAAVLLKEFREYRRSRAIVATMLALPLIFLVEPLGIIFGESSLTPPAGVEKVVDRCLLSS